MAWGDLREEILVGNALVGKPGGHRDRVILLSHTHGWSHHFNLSPHILAPAAEPVEKDPREGGPFSAKVLHLNTKTKPHPKASNLQCWMFNSKPLVISEPILPISRKAAQDNNKHIDTPKHTTGHNTALQRDMIQLHPPEYRHKSSYSGKNSQGTGPTTPKGGRLNS